MEEKAIRDRMFNLRVESVLTKDEYIKKLKMQEYEQLKRKMAHIKFEKLMKKVECEGEINDKYKRK